MNSKESDKIERLMWIQTLPELEIQIDRKNMQEIPYKLGGTDDPHFQDHGGNVLPDRIAANHDQWLLNQIGYERD